MDTKFRKALFTPLSAGTLSAIVPDFYIEFDGRRIETPALLTCNGEEFIFALHFMSSTPPVELGNLKKKFLTKEDQIIIGGQIDGEIAFQCHDVFPPVRGTTRSRGTSMIELNSSKMELIAEGTDKLNSASMRELLKMPPKTQIAKNISFDSHVISMVQNFGYLIRVQI